MKGSLYRLGGLLLALTLLASCIIAVLEDPWSRNAYPSREFHKILSFQEGGELSLENASGEVEIRGWERNEVEISAEMEYGRSQRRRVQVYRADDAFPEIEVDREGDAVFIRSRIGEGDTSWSDVNYFLNVPHEIMLDRIVQQEGNIILSSLYGRVNVELERGDLTIENYSGSIQAFVRRGNVSAGLYDLRDGDEIRIISRAGNITLFLEESVNAEIKADAPNGRISCEFELEKPVSSDRISLKLGEGKAALSLTAEDGDIFIRKH